MRNAALAIVACFCFLIFTDNVRAQLNNRKPQSLNNVGVTEHLGERIPLDLTFANAEGDSVRLGDFFNDAKPVLLNPVYYECPQLCSMVKEGIFKGIKGLQWSPGKDYTIITFSIDPTEKSDLAKKDKERFLSKLNRTGLNQGWHFLSGSEQNIRQLATAIGYEYNKLSNGQFAHGTAVMFLSPNGTITRYLYGIDFKSFNLKNALNEAADGKIGSTTDQILLYCYAYDADANSYVAVGWRVMQLGGIATMIVLGVFLGFMWMRNRHTKNGKQINETNELA